MPKEIFICEGTCGARLTKEQYEKSPKVCGSEGCSRHGIAFTRVSVTAPSAPVAHDGESRP